MTGHDDRRRFLRRAAGAGAVAIGAAVTAIGAAVTASGVAVGAGGAAEASPPNRRRPDSPGLHIATGRWEPTGRRTVTFTLWQVLPDDLLGMPLRYNGEVRALHHAEVRGDTLTSQGTYRGLDIDGNETGRGPVSARATRFDISTF
ncbi:hypothetical protein [Plantactinospora sp. KLBMP9567]|uniref:hypothetical protein n=1 Tax=Plantactinospora sp. KLBMP9567 TaxID=3085900 RepID=UPI0029827453|nr:hypothetical protein [Plantactinospora sp. KLBMP9567]MDW5325423.1 hypothetical protein [Plantactinospora sp. KLBMP9567]